MTTKQAAEIIKEYVAERDKKASAGGLNSTAYALRRVGDAVASDVEDIADDVLAGRGAGSAAASRRLIRVAKAVGQKEGKMKYQIIVGETGNECGHVTSSSHVSDAAAVRKAKRLCAEYDGDGWWRVECDGALVARGGRDN
jgi:hypothetical protein